MGLLNLGAAFSAIFISLSTLGVTGYASREVARVRNNKQQLNSVFTNTFVVHLIGTCVGLIIYCTVVFLQKTHITIFLLYMIMVAVSPFTIEWLYTGLEEFQYVARRNIIIKLFSLLCLFLFVRSEADFIKYALVVIFSSIGNTVYNFIHSRKYVQFDFKDLSIKKTIINSRFFWFQAIIAICYQNVNQLVLGVDTVQLALFTRSQALTGIVMSVITSLCTAVSPRLSATIKNGNNGIYEQYVKTTFNLISFFAIPSIVGLILLGDYVMYLFGGKQYTAAAPVLQISSLLLFSTLYAIFCNSVISVPNGKEKNTMYGNAVVAVVSLVLNFFFIPVHGALGAAIALVCAETCGLCTQWFFIKKQKLFTSFITVKKIKYFVASIVMATVILLLRTQIKSLLILVVAIPLSIVTYAACVFLFSKMMNDDMNEVKYIYFTFIKSRAKKF